MRADGVYPITVTDENVPAIGGGAIQNATAHAIKPVARLLFARKIIHECGGHIHAHVPAALLIQRQKIQRYCGCIVAAACYRPGWRRTRVACH